MFQCSNGLKCILCFSTCWFYFVQMAKEDETKCPRLPEVAVGTIKNTFITLPQEQKLCIPFANPDNKRKVTGCTIKADTLLVYFLCCSIRNGRIVVLYAIVKAISLLCKKQTKTNLLIYVISVQSHLTVFFQLVPFIRNQLPSSSCKSSRKKIKT